MRLEDCIAAVLQLIFSPECDRDLSLDDAVRRVRQALESGSINVPGMVPCISRLLRDVERADEEAERRLAECMERCDAVRRVLSLLAEPGAGDEARAPRHPQRPGHL